MSGERWKQPVRVQIAGREASDVIHSVFEAAQVLTPALANVQGPKVARALSTFIAVMQGEAGPEEARQAFVEATMEAGIAGS